jgi:hypothetical protein
LSIELLSRAPFHFIGWLQQFYQLEFTEWTPMLEKIHGTVSSSVRTLLKTPGKATAVKEFAEQRNKLVLQGVQETERSLQQAAKFETSESRQTDDVSAKPRGICATIARQCIESYGDDVPAVSEWFADSGIEEQWRHNFVVRAPGDTMINRYHALGWVKRSGPLPRLEDITDGSRLTEPSGVTSGVTS